MATVATQTDSRTIDRLLSMTREAILPGIRDQAFNHSPTLAVFLSKMLGDFGATRMRGAGKSTQRGGTSVDIRMGVGKGNAKVMSGPWDTHDTDPSDVVRNSRANWTHYSSNATVSLTDELVNTGEEAIANLVAHETELAVMTLADLLGDHLFDNGGIAGAVTDLDSLISAADTVQGLSGTTYTKFNARGLSPRGTAPASVSFAGASFALSGIANMLTAYNNASEGSIQPNYLTSDYATFERYEGSLTPQQQFVNRNVGDGSFDMLAFKSRPYMPDDKAPANSQWFLRVGDDGLQIKVLAGADFSPQGWKRAYQQEARVEEYALKAQTCVSRRNYSNKITGISD